jgi:hypothetical protein
MRHLLVCFCLGAVVTSARADVLVFSTNFDTTIPPELAPGVATLSGVQGYAGLGPAGNQFGGSFLRSPTGNAVTLSLAGLPAHSAISLDFLFAAIDSLDGTGVFPAGDFFTVTLDGNQIFRESFANALPTQTQSYVPPPGVELARRVDLGFNGPGGFYTDSAYYLGADPVFRNLPHAGSTATFTFEIEGPGIQPLDDESWAMDNLRVSVAPAAAPEPGTLALSGLGALGWLADVRRRRRSRPRGLRAETVRAAARRSDRRGGEVIEPGDSSPGAAGCRLWRRRLSERMRTAGGALTAKRPRRQLPTPAGWLARRSHRSKPQPAEGIGDRPECGHPAG